jgi:hypothetical protein
MPKRKNAAGGKLRKQMSEQWKALSPEQRGETTFSAYQKTEAAKRKAAKTDTKGLSINAKSRPLGAKKKAPVVTNSVVPGTSTEPAADEMPRRKSTRIIKKPSGPETLAAGGDGGSDEVLASLRGVVKTRKPKKTAAKKTSRKFKKDEVASVEASSGDVVANAPDSSSTAQTSSSLSAPSSSASSSSSLPPAPEYKGERRARQWHLQKSEWDERCEKKNVFVLRKSLDDTHCFDGLDVNNHIEVAVDSATHNVDALYTKLITNKSFERPSITSDQTDTITFTGDIIVLDHS